MANLRYHRYSDRITAGTWSLSTGTARTGYPLTALDNGDPSAPFWANETTVRIVKDFGTATQVDAVYIFAHTYVQAATVRVQMHTANSWGTPDIDMPVTVPTAYLDGFTVNLWADVQGYVPLAGDRTRRYLSIVNNVANSVTIAIGEVWIGVTPRTLQRNIRYGLIQERQRLTSRDTSKRGVSTVYDLGSVERRLTGQVPASAQDLADLLTLEEDVRGSARPFPMVLDTAASITRHAEPWFVRLTSPISVAPQDYHNAEVSLALEELGRGELVGA